MKSTNTLGRFITLEGIDGAGKSTHIEWLNAELIRRGHLVVTTREPGGTVLGEQLRKLVLHDPMAPDTEALLMFGARREHLERVIWPALAAGQWVLCDRFTDSTMAYQGGGREVDLDRLHALEVWTHGDFQPDLTLLFDVPAIVGQERLTRETGQRDRFEREQESFFERVRKVYLDRAQAEPWRFRVIDSSRSKEAIRQELSAILDSL